MQTEPCRPRRRLAILAVVTLLGCAAGGEVPRYPETPRAAAEAILIVGDTQAPLWIEMLRLAPDENEDATRRVFHAIARDSACSAVIHLGDLTSLGGLAPPRELFDEESSPLRSRAIPLYPVLGNHEYMPFGAGGLDYFCRRFPFAGEGWYDVRVGGVAILLLNSNFSDLDAEERERQQRWYEHSLARLNADSSVTMLIVACHHPPYTNSTIVEPDEEVRRSFVPPFLGTAKARLFLSGHAHAYEHFRVGGKDFVVSGGGGGLLHPLRRGTDARWPDLYPHSADRSFFHYLRITPPSGALPGRLDVLRLSAGRRTFDAVDAFSLP